jgi:hypothetical protein
MTERGSARHSPQKRLSRTKGRNMNIRNTFIARGLIAFAILLGSMTSASAARADHNYRVLRAKADAVFQSMVELDRTLVDHYVRSRVFGEMMVTSGQIKAKAAYLRGMCYRSSPCEWSRELTGLHALVHNLEALIESAHFRATRGLDPPISFCAIEAGRRLEAIIDLIHCMEDALVVTPVYPVVPAPAPVICNPGYGGYGGYGSPYGGYGGHDGHGHGGDRHYSGYRGGAEGINISGNRGGNVRLDGGGVTIGRGGMQFRINF